jgi:hypothetical protein
MKNIENINELLDLYFAGETTIEQERELKRYFASENILDEHKKYQPLFETFEVEKSVKYPTDIPKIPAKYQQPKRFKLQILTAAIAASLLLLFGIFGLQQSDNYVVINGKRINDKNLAIQTAHEKIANVYKSLDANMQPLNDNINKVKKHLEPLQKLENIQNSISKINIKL